MSGLVVDTPWRRRGYARRLLAACADEARAQGRSHIVLEVARGNGPAQALYQRLGFHPIREKAVLFLDRATAEPPLAREGSSEGIRALRAADARPLAELANQAAAPEFTRILPFTPGAFQLSRWVVHFLSSETAAWVAPSEGPPLGFIRATVGESSPNGHLAISFGGTGLSDESRTELLEVGLGWLRDRGFRRAVTEVPIDETPTRSTLERHGFREPFRLQTLALPLTP